MSVQRNEGGLGLFSCLVFSPRCAVPAVPQKEDKAMTVVHS